MPPRRSSGDGAPRGRSMSPGGNLSPVPQISSSQSPGNGASPSRHAYRTFRSRSPRGRVEVPEDKVGDAWIQDNFRPERWVDRWWHDQPFGGVWLPVFFGIMLGYALSTVALISHNQSPLMSAIKEGDDNGLSIVQALLQHGQPPDTLEVQYTQFLDISFPTALITPLYVAAEGGHIRIVQELLKHRAPHQKGLHSWNWMEVLHSETPLFAAARGGHLAVLQELIRAGASPSEGRLALWGLLGGTSPLHAAVQNPGAANHAMQMVKLLQTEDSYRGHWGLESQETLLYAAAKGGHKDVVEALLANKEYDASSWSWEGRLLGPLGIFGYSSPLYAAAEAGNLEIVELLLKRNAVAGDGWRSLFEQASPLYAAAANGDHKITRALLSANPPASPDAGYSYGLFGLLGHTSPLFAAAEVNSLDTVLQLLGASEEKKTKKWALKSPAATSIGANADPNRGLMAMGWLQLYRTETALYAAARNGNADMVAALLAANAQAQEGLQHCTWGYVTRSSPLYVAAQDRHAETVEKLVASEVDCNIGQSGAFSPVGLGDFSVEIWSSTPLYAAAAVGDVDITKHLLSVQGLPRSSLPSEGYQVLEGTWHIHPLCAAIRGPAQAAHAEEVEPEQSRHEGGMKGGGGNGEEGESSVPVAGSDRGGNKGYTRVAEILIQKGADFEETQCGLGMYIQVYSAEVLAGLVGDLEMYDTVSKTVIRVKRESILSRTSSQSTGKAKRGDSENEILV